MPQDRKARAEAYAWDQDALKGLAERVGGTYTPQADPTEMGGLEYGARALGSIGGSFVQTALVDLPLGIVNLATSALGLEDYYERIYKERAPNMQLRFDVKKQFMGDDYLQQLEAFEEDGFTGSARRVGDSIGHVMGFVWGAPLKVATKLGERALGGAAISAGKRSLERSLLKAKVVRDTLDGIKNAEMGALKMATQALERGDAINAWRNLVSASATVTKDGLKVSQASLMGERLAHLARKYGVPTVTMSQGFAAEAFLEGAGGGTQGGDNSLNSRLGSAFNAAMMAPLYTAAGLAATKLNTHLLDVRKWNPRAAAFSSGMLEGAGFASFEISLLMEGVEAAYEGDYGKLRMFLEHAAGSVLGFGFIKGVRPGNMAVDRLNNPKNYGPTKEYRESIKKIGLDANLADKLWAVDVTVGAELSGRSLTAYRKTLREAGVSAEAAETVAKLSVEKEGVPMDHVVLRGPRGSGETLFLKRTEGELTLIRSKKGHHQVVKGDEAIREFVSDFTSKLRLSAIRGYSLTGLGFEPAGVHTGVFVSPNAKYNVRFDNEGRLQEQVTSSEGGQRSLEWKGASSAGDVKGWQKMAVERYGVAPEKAVSRKMVGDRKRKVGGIAEQQQQAHQEARDIWWELRDMLVNEGHLKRDSQHLKEFDAVLNPLLMSEGHNAANKAEIFALLSSPEMLAIAERIIKQKGEGSELATRWLVEAVGTVASGVHPAEEALYRLQGILQLGEMEFATQAVKQQEVIDAKAEKAEETGDVTIKERKQPSEKEQRLKQTAKDIKDKQKEQKDGTQEGKEEAGPSKADRDDKGKADADDADKAAGKVQEGEGRKVEEPKAEKAEEITEVLPEKPKRRGEEVAASAVVSEIDRRARLKEIAGEMKAGDVISGPKFDAKMKEVKSLLKLNERLTVRFGGRKHHGEARKGKIIRSVSLKLGPPGKEARPQPTATVIGEKVKAALEAGDYKNIKVGDQDVSVVERFLTEEGGTINLGPLHFASEAIGKAADAAEKVYHILSGDSIKDVESLARELVKDYAGERDVQSFRIRMKANATDEKFTRKEQDDMTFYVERTGNPYVEGDTFEALSARLSPEAKAYVDKDVRQHLDKLFDELVDAGYMSAEQHIHDYISHLWTGGGIKNAGPVFSKFQRTMGHDKPRRIPTYSIGVKEAGLVPRFTKLSDILAFYESKVLAVRMNNAFIKKLTRTMDTPGKEGVPLIVPKGKAAEGRYSDMGHPALRDHVVLNEIVRPMEKVFDWTAGSRGWFHALHQVNMMVKGIRLSGSFFHFYSLLESAFQVRDVRGQFIGLKSLLPTKAMKKMRMDLIEGIGERAVRGGLSVSVPGDVGKHIIDNFLEGVWQRGRTPGSNVIMKVFGQTARALKHVKVKMWDKALWENLHTTLKLSMWHKVVMKATERAQKQLDSGEVTQKQLDREASAFVNDAFGGQNWMYFFRGMRTKGRQRFAQMALLAPDWTISNLRVFGRGLAGISSGLTGGKVGFNTAPSMRREAVAYLGRSIALATIGTQFYQWIAHYLLLTDEDRQALEDEGKTVWLWDNDPNPKMGIPLVGGFIDKGKHVAPILGARVGRNDAGQWEYAMPMKQITEVLRWGQDPKEIGGAKLSPLVHLALENLTGHSAGSEFPAPWEGMSFWPSLPERLKKAVLDALPIGLTSKYQFAMTLPKRSGMSRFKAADLLTRHLADYAYDDSTSESAIKGMEAIIDSAKSNNVPIQDAFRAALYGVRGQAYGELIKALNVEGGPDEAAVEKAARALIRLGVKASNAKTALQRRFVRLAEKGEIHFSESEWRSRILPDVLKRLRTRKGLPIRRYHKKVTRESKRIAREHTRSRLLQTQ